MKKRISNVMLTLALTICTVLSAVLLPVSQAKAANPGYRFEPTLSVQSGVAKSTTVFTARMQLEPGAMVLNGLDITISFDEKAMVYQAGSINILQPILKDSKSGNYAVHYNGNGEIRFVWTGTGTKKLPQNFDVLSIEFAVQDKAAEGLTPIKMEVTHCYQTVIAGGQVQFSELDNLTGNIYKTIQFDVQSQAAVVQNVESLINAIGTVEYTEGSKAKIDAAQQAYDKLTTEQKALVTNYATLVNAQDTYKTLQQQNTPQSEIQKAVEKYKEDYKEALALTSKDINEATKAEEFQKLATLISDALIAYDKQLPAVQAELHRYKVTLNSLSDLLDKVAADVNEQIKQEGYKKEAEEIIKAFRENNAYVLSRDPEKVTIVDDADITEAWTVYEIESAAKNTGIYFKEGSADIREKLEALLKRMTELKQEANPEVAEEVARAEQWKADFAAILTLKPEDLTYEDTVDVRLAKLLLDSYDEKTQALLEKERVIIDALYEAALGIYPEEGEVIYETVEVEVEGETTVIEKVVNKLIGRDLEIEIQNKKISNLIWYLLLFVIVAAIIFAALRIYYYFKVTRGGKKREKTI